MTLDEAIVLLGEEFGAHGCTTHRIAIALLGATHLGPNNEKVAKWSRQSRDKVRLWFNRLRYNGLFVGGKIPGEWADPKTGIIAFHLAVMVANGLVQTDRAGMLPGVKDPDAAPPKIQISGPAEIQIGGEQLTDSAEVSNG